ncbi:hypothetical protein ACHAXR_002275 [Thalassiosira sp. AJA248-18]
MWNSVISTPDVKYMTADIKSFYLETPLDRFEYMKMNLDIIPQEFQDAYDLDTKAKGGHVVMEIHKGYFEMPRTPRLWKHVSGPVAFTLVVDDFGVKYVEEQHARHLIEAIKGEYTVKVDWAGELYCGIKLAWDYEKQHVHIAMPTYVGKQLVRYAHPPPPSANTTLHMPLTPPYLVEQHRIPPHPPTRSRVP